jgi:hypothetical protein
MVHQHALYSLTLHVIWCGAQIAAMRAPRTPSSTVRLMAVRHGMAEHNRWQGTGSISNRDAPLTELGISQAKLVGAAKTLVS